MFTREEETRGLALVGQAMSYSLLSLLKAKGVISDADAAHVIENTLHALEDPKLDDGAVRVARIIVEELARINAG